MKEEFYQVVQQEEKIMNPIFTYFSTLTVPVLHNDVLIWEVDLKG